MQTAALLPQSPDVSRHQAGLDRVAAELEKAGAQLSLEGPGAARVRIGAKPSTRVVFENRAAWKALARRDLLTLADAYMGGQIAVEGDFLEVIKLAGVIDPGPSLLRRARSVLSRPIRSGARQRRRGIAFHYDRPAEFFLPWLGRWRSYSHGLYESSTEDLDRAQERKLARAFDALGLEPGMTAFDMGCGWGSFLEYAGRRGVHVHGITLSAQQHRFVSRIIREQQLPCRVELVDFARYEPTARFDAAVFMGSFEHFENYRGAARFLAAHLAPGARFWADFVTARGHHRTGPFLAKYIFGGAASYVRLPTLLEALLKEGLHVHELADDTSSYELSCRDWANGLERESVRLSNRFAAKNVRAFQIYLRASQYFFATNRTQAHHLVAGRAPATRSG